MDKRKSTAQVVLLIDSDICRQCSGDLQHNVAFIRLACLRLLSSFKYNSDYRQLRWSYRFYSLNSSHLAVHRHTPWKEFTTQTFEEFESLLTDTLIKPAAADDSAAQHETDGVPLAVSYSNTLCAVIEDFQWEIPDISSPVKSARQGRSASSTLENYVFNFHLSPTSLKSLTTFTGVICSRPSHLVKAVMSVTAKHKWIEKYIRLYWVDTAHPTSNTDEAKELCCKALREYNGDLLSLSQLVTTGDHMLLPAIVGTNKQLQAPAVPVCQMISQLLKRRENKDKCQMNTLTVCRTDNSIMLRLKVHSIGHSSKLRVEYLYISGIVFSQHIKLHYLDQQTTYLCTAEGEHNSQLSQLLVELAKNNKLMVLTCKIDCSLYCLKPLTITTATLSKVRDTYSSCVEESLKCHIRDSSLVKGDVTYAGCLIDPTAQPCKVESISSRLSVNKEKAVARYEALREEYRTKKCQTKLIEPAQSVRKDLNSRPALSSTINEKLPQLTRGSKCVEEAAKKRSSLELPSKSASNVADDHKIRLPATKKIALTTISSLILSTETELISYTTKSYEEACTAQQPLYLTAQKLVNTARVFYKKELNPQVYVEKLLSEVIKPVSAIRKSCVGDSERKCRECQMCSLLILELEALKKELSVQEENVDTEVDDIVSKLEEYLTCMSLGKPDLLRDYLYNQLIPSYQVTLAPVLAALLTEFGQDMPISLKRLVAAENEEKLPSLSSVNSRRSSLPSPSGVVLSFNSMFSDPCGSLMSSTMAGSRSLQVRSMSDKGRRSIAIPGALLKKSRNGKRRSSKGVSSRTRSKTPNKDGEPFLTEFPTGFLSRLNEGQTLSGIRRSPRIASLPQPSVSAAKVKRDLFSSPTTSARRKSTRSPRRHRPNKEHAGPDRRVLVAETPLHKQGYVFQSTGQTALSPSNTQVVEETPSKPAGDTAIASSSLPVSAGARRFSRRTSFYDMEGVKSRNVEKFQKLDNRMKCSLSAKCSPRRAAKLILMQALSQPTERVFTRLTPGKDNTESPVKRLPRIHRKSTGSNMVCADENIEPKAFRKKKLFMSPMGSSPTSKLKKLDPEVIILETPEKDVTLRHTVESEITTTAATTTAATTTAATTPKTVITPCKVTLTPLKMEQAQNISSSGALQASVTTGAGALQASVTTGAPEESKIKGMPESEELPQITNTPTKPQTTTCACGTQTPRGTRRSPRSCVLSQRKVCQFTNGATSPTLHNQTRCTSTPPLDVFSSPKRLNFMSRKRGRDPLGVKVANSSPEIPSSDLVPHTSRQQLDNTPHNESIKSLSGTPSSSALLRKTAKTQPQFLSPPRTSVGLTAKVTPQHSKLFKSNTSPKYSPLSTSDLQSLLKSPFVRLDRETASQQD